MDFDKIIKRRGSNCSKWDMMEKTYGVSAQDGLAMWVADMDFQSPQCVQDAVKDMHDHGIYGYVGDAPDYHESIVWWMKERHNWEIDPSWIFTTYGVVNGTAICLDVFTKTGDGVVLMTPVYHAFHRLINAAGRQIVECKLINNDDHYTLDIPAYDALMTGNESMLILCSPHNPGGRVWTRQELQDIADFAIRHNLVIVSDEIHHDLVFPGHTHIPMANIEGIDDRLIILTAASKVFNIPGSKCGNVIIKDGVMHKKFASRLKALGMEPNTFGTNMTRAAYSVEGAEWVDQLVDYIDANRKIFDDGINAIAGLKSMLMESTYLAWVDFSEADLTQKDFLLKVEKDARIAVNHGTSFGAGGENFLRFNIGTPRSIVEKAINRMQKVFAN